ncbi:MAG TPA: hypothetical protein VNA25_24945 [Phycisphaerae bacterium]|nr:hypothetical protein [Phycisphaerae bacterium]
MDEHRSEALGFLCRWCLLAVGCAAVLGAAYMGLSAAVSTGSAERVRLILVDEISRPATPTWVGCLTEPPTERDGGNLLMGGVPGGPRSFLGFWSGAFHLRSAAAVRLSRTTACGVPYLRLSDAQAEARLLAVPTVRRVFFVEAHLAEQALAAQPQAWDRCLGLLRRRGEVAFVHPGPVVEYEAFRSRLRAAGQDEPVLGSLTRPDGSVRVLRGVAKRMGGNGAADMMVLTDRPAVAGAAANLGFVSHLIGAGEGVSPHRNLRRHESLQDLIEHLIVNP